MLKFLIDENLSPHLKYAFAPGEAVHARDIGESQTDTQLWEYATAQQLCIITKDTDFLDRMRLAQPPACPLSIIKLNCGNLKAKDTRAFLERHLSEMLDLLPKCRVIQLYPEHLEALP